MFETVATPISVEEAWEILQNVLKGFGKVMKVYLQARFKFFHTKGIKSILHYIARALVNVNKMNGLLL